jgi:uncharacterized protein (TIGR02302 family)
MTIALIDPPAPPVSRLSAALRGNIARARRAIIWEHWQPAVLHAAAPLFLFALACLFGLMAAAPLWLRITLALVAACASAFALFRGARTFRPPTIEQSIRRVESDSGLAHAPLQALLDAPFDEMHGAALWSALQRDAADRARRARPPRARVTTDAADPWALRYAAPGLLAIALVVAGPEWRERLTGVFSSRIAGPVGVDLWIEPPAYTGAPTVYLARADAALAGLRAQTDAPEGSIVRLQAGDGVSATYRTATEEGAFAPIEADGAEASAGRGALVWRLTESGLITVHRGATRGRWPVGVKPDRAPNASFLAAPEIEADGRIALVFAADDDYGLAGARLELRLDPEQTRPLDSPAIDAQAVRALRSIEIAGMAGPPGGRRARVDARAEPWAGLSVFARVVVVDGAGKLGRTEEHRIVLPAHPFVNPVARAVVEQRQTLAIAQQEWPRAARALDALTLAPEMFIDQPQDYLLLRAAFRRLVKEQNENIDGAVSAFWQLALQLEDAELHSARAALDAAREALREALDGGASEEEIRQRIEDLRAALSQYLSALARAPQQGGPSGEADMTVTPQDLEERLDALRDLAGSGARKAAADALSELEEILDALRSAGASGGAASSGPGGGGRSDGASAKASSMIAAQRDLADRTYERGARAGAEGDDLAAEQSDLADALDQLLEGPNGAGDARAPLEGARDAMKDAEAALRSGEFDAAGAAMARAIKGLADGAGKLRQGSAQGQAGGVDPLGRPIDDGSSGATDIPETFDVERARALREELRRRLSDGVRSQEEIDYLERLLERF